MMQALLTMENASSKSYGLIQADKVTYMAPKKDWPPSFYHFKLNAKKFAELIRKKRALESAPGASSEGASSSSTPTPQVTPACWTET